MPNVRKLSADEVRNIEKKGKGQRKLIEEEYDAILRDYDVGEYGEALLSPDEKRITIRNRLKAAAERRGLALEFKRTKGDLLRFKVVPPDQEAEVVSSDEAPRTRGRGGRRKQTAA